MPRKTRKPRKMKKLSRAGKRALKKKLRKRPSAVQTYPYN